MEFKVNGGLRVFEPRVQGIDSFGSRRFRLWGSCRGFKCSNCTVVACPRIVLLR